MARGLSELLHSNAEDFRAGAESSALEILGSGFCMVIASTGSHRRPRHRFKR